MIIMNKKISAFATVLTLLIGQSVYFNKSNHSAVRYDQKRLIVKAKSKLAFKDIQNIDSVRHFFGDIYIVRVTQLEKAERSLKENSNIISVERNRIQKVDLANEQSLPYFETPINQRVPRNDLMKSEHFNDPGFASLKCHIEATPGSLKCSDFIRSFLGTR